MSDDGYQELLERFPAAADYLSNMYLIQRDYGEISNGKLSAWLGVSPAAVSQAVGRLKTLGLVSQAPYGAAFLSEKGKDFATRILRRHYLLEHVLVRVLKYPWDKADDEAHILQNHVSDELVEHIDTFLGRPDTCPHGNPLPGSNRESELLNAPSLADAQSGQEIMILRITEEGESVAHMLSTCQNLGIHPGSRCLVESVDDTSLSLVLEAESANTAPRKVLLARNLASFIRYRLR